MKKIGITGGVGAGKSEVINYLKDNCNCRIIMADRLAEELQSPGNPCYNMLLELFGNDITDGPKAPINRKKMADIIFRDKGVLKKVNDIVHPAVKRAVIDAMAQEEAAGRDYFFLEAALLVEAGYRDMLDEIWYIYAPMEVRSQRLMKSRGYSSEKVKNIMDNQKSDDYFRQYADRIIDNGGDFKDTAKTLLQLL